MATNGVANGNGQANLDTLKRDEQRVPVHSFDPDASPTDKAAAAGKARDQLKSVSAASEAPERGKTCGSTYPPLKLSHLSKAFN